MVPVELRQEIIIIITSDRIRVHHFGRIDNSQTHSESEVERERESRNTICDYTRWSLSPVECMPLSLDANVL